MVITSYMQLFMILCYVLKQGTFLIVAMEVIDINESYLWSRCNA